MSLPFDRPVISPILVGRGHYQASLLDLAARVESGSGQVALISGEAGTGKTRLLVPIKQQALRRGWRILEGRCFEPDRAYPYAPLLDILRSYFGLLSAEEVGRLLGPLASDLARLVPELYARLPDLVPTPGPEPEEEKRRLFETLTLFFVRVASLQPLLVVVEDLHWSDDTSLEFLVRFARRVASQRILVLMTYRSEDVQPALRHFLSDLDRQHLAAEFPLPPLAREEVAEMLRAIFGLHRPVRAEFLQAIYTLSEGNPFFIEEMLKSLVAAGELNYAGETWDGRPIHELHIPRSVQDAVQRRMFRLEAPSHQVLLWAAVAGRRFDFSLLQELTQMNEQQLVAALKELVGAQLIVEESGEQFAFRHALTREAVYGTLLIRERRRFHLAIGETIERAARGEGEAAQEARGADLAYHYYEAGSWEKALEYSQRAGERAQALYAPREAVYHFTHALDAAERLGRGIPPRLYRARGQAYETLGDFEAAHREYRAALDTARQNQDAGAEWQSLIDLGFLWTFRDYAQAGEYFRRALDLAPSLQDPRRLAHSLNRLGNWLVNMEDTEEGTARHGEALAIFEQLGDQAGVAETLDLLGMANAIGGDPPQATEFLQRAIGLFRELGDRGGLASSLTTRAICGVSFQMNTLAAGESSADAVRDAEAALETARSIGHRAAESYALWTLGNCLGLQGEYGRALAAAQAALEIAEEIQHRQWISASHFILGAIYFELYATEQAERHLEQSLAVAQETRSPFWRGNATSYLARTLTQRGHLDRARALIDAALAPTAAARTAAQRGVQAARAELFLAQGDPAGALEMTTNLISTAGEGDASRIVTRLEKLRGDILFALGRRDEAEQAFLRARGEALRVGIRSMAWRAEAALAKLVWAAPRREEALARAEAARAEVQNLAATIEEKEVRDRFVGEAEQTLPPAPAPTPAATAKSAIGGLTARELEVAQQIALGRSSREIAQALVVSQRTVETHVGSVLSKLGFTSRSQIAAWIVEKGLKPREANPR